MICVQVFLASVQHCMVILHANTDVSSPAKWLISFKTVTSNDFRPDLWMMKAYSRICEMVSVGAYISSCRLFLPNLEN